LNGLPRSWGLWAAPRKTARSAESFSASVSQMTRKLLPAISRARGWGNVPGTGDDEFRKGGSSQAIDGHFGVPGGWLACGGRRGCRVSLIQRRRIEPQCLVESRSELLRRHHSLRREERREARDKPLHVLIPAATDIAVGSITVNVHTACGCAAAASRHSRPPKDCPTK
jgi:hypothetical protein